MRSFEYSLYNPTGQKRFTILHPLACLTLSHDKVAEMDSMETALEKTRGRALTEFHTAAPLQRDSSQENPSCAQGSSP